MKAKNKRLVRNAAVFAAVFAVSTPAVMYLSTGAATWDLFAEGFWMIGLLQALALTAVVNHFTESKRNRADFLSSVKADMERHKARMAAAAASGTWQPADMSFEDWDTVIQNDDPIQSDDPFEDRSSSEDWLSRKMDPFYSHEVGNTWHGTDLDPTSEEYWK